MNKSLILVVEDDTSVRNLITTTLKTHEYRYLTAPDGQSAILETSSHNPDIVLLDLGLPDIDGVEIIKKIRTWSNMPIIVISARSEDTDKIDALDAGADDYLMKPFSVGELLARIRSLTRRNTQFSPLTLSAGSVHLNIEEQNLSCKNSISLNHKETKLMKLFMTNMDKSLSTNHIFSAIWADEIDADENIVWIYISYLREKLEAINTDIQIFGQKGQDFLLTKK